MKIDWFTVFAQIVNFLVLLAILKFLLFDRILAAVDQRKQKLASEREEARAARERAEDERARAEATRRELEETREDRLREAQAAADERRRTLEQEVRDEIEQMRERFGAMVREEQSQLVAELVRTSAHGVAVAARRALRELSSTDLEERMVDLFCDRLRHSDDQERRKLRDAWAGLDQPLVVRTSRELGAKQRDRLVAALERALTEGDGAGLDLQWEVSEKLACGIEVSGAGYAVGWSIDAYLSEVEATLREALDREISRESAEPEARAVPGADEERAEPKEPRHAGV